MAKRFGPTAGAGVRVEELDADKLLEAAPLGVAAFIGASSRGETNKLLSSASAKQALRLIGKRVGFSEMPRAAQEFWTGSAGAGELHFIRVTDGTERKATKTIWDRNTAGPTGRSQIMTLTARSGGRWAGRWAALVGIKTGLTETTMPTGLTMKVNEWKGATLKLDGVASRSYTVVSNTIDGIITVKSDSLMLTDYGVATDTGFLLELSRDTASEVTFTFGDGDTDSADEFSLTVFVDGLFVKKWGELSMDPDSAHYFVRMINDDDSNDELDVADLNAPASVSAAKRPANEAGVISAVSALSLTRTLHQLRSTVGNANPSAALGTTDDTMCFQDRMEFTIVSNLVTGAPGATTVGAAIGAFTSPPSAGEMATLRTRVNAIKADLAAVRAVITGAPGATVGADLGAFTDPPSVGEMGALRTFLNALRADDTALRAVLPVTVASASTAPATAAFTAPPSAPEMALVRTLVNELRTSVIAINAYAAVPATVFTAKSVDLGGNTSIGSGIVGALFTPSTPFLPPVTLTEGSTVLEVGDKVVVDYHPWVPDSLKNGYIFPNIDDAPATKYRIAGNTHKVVTIQSGDLTDQGSPADVFRIEWAQPLGGSQGTGGHDGGTPSDANFQAVMDPGSTKLLGLMGENKGLVKLATPGVTSTLVQQAGAALAEASNWQYRAEIPSDKESEQDILDYVNNTLGRSDYVVTAAPSYGYISDPDRPGQLALVSMTGMILGAEALVAKNFDGYHKAAAGIDVKLPAVAKLPVNGLNEEQLNPQGVNVIKRKKGNTIVWGDRTLCLDPAWKFKHHRESMSHYENRLRDSFDWVVFALNDKLLWGQLVSTLTAMFLPEWRKRALRGDSFKEACSIKVDADNNDNASAAAGDLNAEIKLRLADTVERFVIRVGKAGIFDSLG